MTVKAQLPGDKIKGAALLFFAVLKEENLPLPTQEYRFDAERKWRFDYAWPEHKIALEVEGGVWTQGRHTRGTGFRNDMEKYNRAVALGWRLIRVEPKELYRRSTINQIKNLIA